METKLRTDNPYRGSRLINFIDNEPILSKNLPDYKPNSTDTYLTISEGESLSDIAYEKYGNSKEWFVIYLANLELILDPFILIPGITIIIPNLLNFKARY